VWHTELTSASDPAVADLDKKEDSPDVYYDDTAAAVIDPSKLKKAGDPSGFWSKHTWLAWYLAPVSSKASLSAYAVFFHLLNFGISTAIGAFIVAALSSTIPLIIIFVGVPLTWLAVEILIVLARLHVATCFPLDWLQSDGSQAQRDSRKARSLTVFNPKSAPYVTSVFCPSDKGRRMERIKYVFFTWHTYALLFFYLVINPIVVCVTAASDVIAASVGTFAVSPILYAIGGHAWFNKKTECWGRYETDDNRCHGWAWNNGWKITLACVAGLILFPLALHLCILCANFAKESIYFFVCDDNYSHAERQAGMTKLLSKEKGIGRDDVEHSGRADDGFSVNEDDEEDLFSSAV
jgi:hypothetical protein